MNAWHNAAKSYKKSDPEGQRLSKNSCIGEMCLVHVIADYHAHYVAAVSALHQAIKLLVQAGNFRQAADREKEVSLQPRILSLSTKWELSWLALLIPWDFPLMKYIDCQYL